MNAMHFWRAGRYEVRVMLFSSVVLGVAGVLPAADRVGFHAIAYSPDGKYLAAAGEDRKLRVWRTSDGRVVHEQSVEAPLRSVAYSAKGDSIAVGGVDRHVYLWRVGKNGLKPVWHKRLASGEVSTVAFSPDGRWLACGSYGGDVVRFLDTPSGTLRRTAWYGGNGISAVAFLHDGKTLVSGGQVFAIWDMAKLKLQMDVEEKQPPPADDAGSADSAIRHRGAIGWTTGVAVAPDDSWVFAAGVVSREDEGRPLTVVMIDPKEGKITRTLARLPSHVTGVAASGDGKFVAAADDQGAVRVWNVKTGNLAQALKSSNKDARSVAFSPKAGWVSVVGDAGVVETWDLSTGQPRPSLKP